MGYYDLAWGCSSCAGKPELQSNSKCEIYEVYDRQRIGEEEDLDMNSISYLIRLHADMMDVNENILDLTYLSGADKSHMGFAVDLERATPPARLDSQKLGSSGK